MDAQSAHGLETSGTGASPWKGEERKGSEGTVVVLDGEGAELEALGNLLRASGHGVKLYHDAEALLERGLPRGPACLILDNDPQRGWSGLRIHAEILKRGWHLPTIFLCSHWNVQDVVKAIRAGACDCLPKPYDPAKLLASVGQAMGYAFSIWEAGMKSQLAAARAGMLTAREQEVVRLIIAGRLNKEIADQLGISLPTVKFHRSRAMRKIGAGNAAELASLSRLGGLCD